MIKSKDIISSATMIFDPKVKKTFLIGAGFSYPFGLPLSRELLPKVLKFARETPELLEIVRIDPSFFCDGIDKLINQLFPEYERVYGGVPPIEEVLTGFVALQDTNN